MTCRVSWSAGLRPALPGCRDRRRQWAFQPMRCHRMTVPGLTMMRWSRQFENQRQARTRNRRSASRIRGRAWRRLRTTSCWRRHRFSAASRDLDLAAAARKQPRGTVKLTEIHSFSTQNQFVPTRQISDLAGMSISGTCRKSVTLTVPLVELADPTVRCSIDSSWQKTPCNQSRSWFII